MGLTDGMTDGRIIGKTNGRLDGRKAERMEGRTIRNHPTCVLFPYCWVYTCLLLTNYWVEWGPHKYLD